jgi:hypothetical protein
LFAGDDAMMDFRRRLSVNPRGDGKSTAVADMSLAGGTDALEASFATHEEFTGPD